MVFNNKAKRLRGFNLEDFIDYLFDIDIKKFPKPGLKLKELFF
jgi:hypothetical protein